MRDPRMHAWCLGGLLSAAACIASAESTWTRKPSEVSPGAASEAPASPPLAVICSKPPTASMLEAYARTSPAQDKRVLRVRVAFDAGGQILDAQLEHSSGDADLDSVILAWAWRVRICPGSAGAGFIPLTFSY